MVPEKNGPRKNSPRKIGPRKNGPGKLRNKKILGRASNIVVCVECWDMINLCKPNTRQQTQNSDTINHGVSVEHSDVRVECSDVINLWKLKTLLWLRISFDGEQFF